MASLCYVTSSGGSCASADTVLTPAQLRGLVGDEISGKIYNGTDYTDVTFRYAFSSTVQRVDDASLGLSVGQTVVCWDCSVSGFTPSTDPQFITVDLQPLYSFFDTQKVDMVCGLSAANDVSASVYSAPQWYWYQSGYGDRNFYNDFVSSGGVRSCVVVYHNNAAVNMGCTAVRAVMDSQSTFSAYSKRACFYGNSNYSLFGSRGYLFFMTLPTVSDDSSYSSGTFLTSQTGGTGDINVSVIVDNSDVVSAIDGLATYPAETAETVATIPSGYDVQGALTGANDIIDDLPAVVESTGFWLYFLGRIFGVTFDNIPVFQSFALVLVFLSIFSYILWRK